MPCGQGHTKRYVDAHGIVKSIPQKLSDVLPAVHSLTGCNTTSKISAKYNAIKTVTQNYYHLLTEFGKSEMDNRSNSNAEEYLIHCHSKSANNEKRFNDLRYSMYHQKSFQMDVEKLPCTSSIIQYHILRSYFQCFHWLHAPHQNEILFNLKDFGYDLNEDQYLVSIIIPPDNILPVDYPTPCNCLKCSRENICVCRSLSVPYYQFCKGEGVGQCCDPHNIEEMLNIL